MEAIDVLQSLGIEFSNENIEAAERLGNIYKVLKNQRANITLFTLSDGYIYFGNTYYYKCTAGKWSFEPLYKGIKMPGQKIIVATTKGKYVFEVPTRNKFYRTLSKTIGIPRTKKIQFDDKVLLFTKYLELIYSRFNEIYIHQYPNRVSLRCIGKDGNNKIITNSKTVFIARDVANAMAPIAADVAEKYERKLNWKIKSNAAAEAV